MAGPVVGLGESLTARLIPVIEPLLQSMPNEAGQTVSVPVRSMYVMERARWPLVTARVILGDVHMGSGENILWWDEAAATMLRGMRVPGSQFVLDILARSDPERYYIADTLCGGLLANYMVLPSGKVLEGAVIQALRQQGLVVTAVRSPQFPTPAPGEGRPEGQSYHASLVVEGDAWFTWQTPGVVLNVDGAPVSQEPDADPYGPSVVEHAQSFWTIRAPGP